jgi:glycosyltransferase involved in cell wall biosynthesis
VNSTGAGRASRWAVVRMKILHVISAPAAGGAEVYVKDLAVCLSASGHDVHIGFVAHASDEAGNREVERSFLEELDTAGIPFFFVGEMSRYVPLAGAMRVRKYVQKNDIDVYHAHLIYGVVFGAFLRIPRVYTHHNIRMRLSRSMFRQVCRFVDQLVGISGTCADRLAAHSGRDVETIFNGTDLRKFASKAVSRTYGHEPIECIAVGRICEQKNYPMMIEALARLPNEALARVRLSIVGGGAVSDVSALEKCIDELGLRENVRLAGLRDDVPDLMRKSDIFLMSSIYEGLPIALIEATAAGLPALVTDVGGCTEIIDACQNGNSVAAGNADAFARAICHLVLNPDLMATYSRNAIQNAGKFSIERSCSDHMALYNEQLSPSREQNRNSRLKGHTQH